MKTKYITNIAEALSAEAKIYFTQSENIDIIDTRKWKSNPFDAAITLINFTGKLNIRIMLCIENGLFRTLFVKYFENIDESEREELEEAFPDEILNLIAGLSIRHFPKELEDLVLGTPYKLKLDDIKTIFADGKCEANTLSTEYGNIEIYIAEM